MPRKKLLSASGMLLLTTIAFADSKLDIQDCNNRGGIYYNGVCTSASIYGEVAGVQMNSYRYSGGNETSVGDYMFQFDGRVSKSLDNRHFKTIFINISAIPDEQVLDYMEKQQQNYHNENRFRADGYADRPWLIANIGGEIDITDSQEISILAGSFEANGLHPLKGKPSRYYMSAPYGLIVRYDKGLQINYELKDRLEKIISTSFSVIDGDGIKGQSSVTPSDSRANSYPSGSGTFEVQVANALKAVFSGLTPYLDNHNLYLGVTGSTGDTGSYVGEKRRQNDLVTYLGYMVKTSKGEGEVRVFKAQYDRNPINDGNGNHVPVITSKAQGVEVAFRGFETRFCDFDVYGNAHYFEANDNGPDGEFIWKKDVKAINGWTAGISCQNIKNVSNLNIGVEYGELNTLDKNGEYLQQEKIVSLVFSYKMGTANRKKNK